MADLVPVLIGILFGSLAAIIFASLIVLAQEFSQLTRESKEEFVVRYKRFFRIFAVICGLIFPVFLVVILVLQPPRSPREVLLAESLLVFYKLTGWVYIRTIFKFGLLVSEEEVVRYSAWSSKVNSLRWEDISKISYTFRWNHGIVFTGKNGCRIHIPPHVTRLRWLFAAMVRHLAPEVYAPLFRRLWPGRFEPN